MHMSFSAALLYSLLGISIVFFALVLLMLIIKLMTAVGDRFSGSKRVEAVPAAPVSPAPAASKPAGSCFGGEVKLYDTDPATAAMLMAIVADSSGIPLNELNFISIKEVTGEN